MIAEYTKKSLEMVLLVFFAGGMNACIGGEGKLVPRGGAGQIERTVTAHDIAVARALVSTMRRIRGTAVFSATTWPAGLPVDGGAISSRYGFRHHPVTGGWRPHHGVDLAVPEGTAVRATAEGRVARMSCARSGYGCRIDLHHVEAGLLTRYAHLSAFADGLREGTAVRAGQEIGRSGSTGTVTGPHLHYEVRALRTGASLDPAFFLPGGSGFRASGGGGR